MTQARWAVSSTRFARVARVFAEAVHSRIPRRADFGNARRSGPARITYRQPAGTDADGRISWWSEAGVTHLHSGAPAVRWSLDAASAGPRTIERLIDALVRGNVECRNPYSSPDRWPRDLTGLGRPSRLRRCTWDAWPDPAPPSYRQRAPTMPTCATPFSAGGISRLRPEAPPPRGAGRRGGSQPCPTRAHRPRPRSRGSGCCGTR